MGQALRRDVEDGGGGGAPVGRGLWAVSGRLLLLRSLALTLLLVLWPTAQSAQPTAQSRAVRLRGGRFTILFSARDEKLARSMLSAAVARDSYPGLPRPSHAVTVQIAGNREHFRLLVGPYAPEWGSAIAFPEAHRIVMQGQRAGSDAGDPIAVLRHELAHLALHEALGDLPPRWFDEGYASYAAGEWSREQALETNVALALRGPPTFDALEDAFSGGAGSAQQAYALAYRAVAELASLDPQRGLAPLFVEWRRTGRLDPAVRGAYGLTLASFEERWQRRTRRRYGFLALAVELTAVTALLGLLILPLYAVRKRRDRVRMAALVAADRAAERDDQEVLGILLGPPEIVGSTDSAEHPEVAADGDEKPRAPSSEPPT
jgi:hypothetical protein